MNNLNRGLVTFMAIIGLVFVVALLLIPLPTFDMLQKVVAYLRAQALIYNTATRLIAGIVGILLLALLAGQLFVRRPVSVPIRNTGRGIAMLDLRTIQQAVNAVLARSLDLKQGKATVQGFSEGVAIYLDLEFHAADYLTDKIAAIHEAVRDDVEERLGVAILTLKSSVQGKPYPQSAQSVHNEVSESSESPREAAWDTRELRRRLERSILNQTGVADLECKIGYHADGASLFLHLFIEPDVNVAELVARVERLCRAIIEEDFNLMVYDIRTTTQVLAAS